MHDIVRANVCAALSVEYSYAELLEIAADMRREMARRRAIERMFAVLSGEGHVEQVLYCYYQRRLAVTRECWLFSGPQYARAAYRNLKSDPKKYSARLAYKAEHKRKRQQKTAPGYARGERSGGSKLTEEKVREILASGLSGTALAKKHGVSPATISGIRNRTKWAHVQSESA